MKRSYDGQAPVQGYPQPYASASVASGGQHAPSPALAAPPSLAPYPGSPSAASRTPQPDGSAPPLHHGTVMPPPRSDPYANYGYGPKHDSHHLNRQAQVEVWAAQTAAQQAAHVQSEAQAQATAAAQAAQAYYQSQMRNANGQAPLYPSYSPEHQQLPAPPQPPTLQSPPTKRPRYDSNGNVANGAPSPPPPVSPAVMSGPPPPGMRPPPGPVRHIVQPPPPPPPPRNVFPPPYNGPTMHHTPPYPMHPPPGYGMPPSPGYPGPYLPPMPMNRGPPPPMPNVRPPLTIRARNGPPLPPQKLPPMNGRMQQPVSQRGRGGRGVPQDRNNRNRNARTRQTSGQDDKRRAFSDFRIASIQILELEWTWLGDPASREPSALPEETKVESRGKHAREEDSEDDRDVAKKVKAAALETSPVERSHSTNGIVKDAATADLASLGGSSPNTTLSKLPDEPGTPQAGSTSSEKTGQDATKPDSESDYDAEDLDGVPADLSERPPSPAPSHASTVGKSKQTSRSSGREGNRLRIYFGSTPETTAKPLRRPPLPVRPKTDAGIAKDPAPDGDESASSEQTHEAPAAVDTDPADASGEQPQTSPQLGTPLPELRADRVSISYARNTRRLIIDAAVIEKLRLFRAERRIEIVIVVERPSTETPGDGEGEGEQIFKGVMIEAMGDGADNFVNMDSRAIKEAWSKDRARETGGPPSDGRDEEATDELQDQLLPPLHRLQIAAPEQQGEVAAGKATQTAARIESNAKLTVIVHLDAKNPFGEPKWVRSGQIDEWIAQASGRKRGEGEWLDKIDVVDPEPPPTFQHALDTWITSSSLDVSRSELRRFASTHMQQPENVIEVLLRVVRGDARQDRPLQHSQQTQPPAVAKLARELKAPYPSHQTHVSLATFSLYKMAIEHSGPPDSDGRKAADKRVGEIVRALPYHLVFRVLDSMAREALRL